MKLSWIACAICIREAIAVKSYLFRTCEKNPFCNRNRHYAEVAKSPDFVSPYQIPLDSVDTSNPAHVTALLSKSTPAGTVDLNFCLDIVSDSTVHITVNEKNRVLDSQLVNPHRFSPAEYIVESSDLEDPIHTPIAEVNSKGLQINFGVDYGLTLSVSFSPVVIRLFRDGEEQIVMNDRKLLNIEQLRSQEDANAWNTFELQGDEAWEDTFDSKEDKRVKGPESIALDVDFPGYENVYGIPEHADSLSLKTTCGDNATHSEPYRLFNVDIFEYEVNSTMPMYGSIPFMLAQKPGSTAGVFWLNSADTYIDIAKQPARTNTHWISENGVMDVYLFLGEKPQDVIHSYAKITGTAALPPLFAVGYHQCRWNYNSQRDLLDVNKLFDEHEIPVDTLWLDIEFTDNKKHFTWDYSIFPEPLDMMGKLAETNRKLVLVLDPHFKAVSNFEFYEEIVKDEYAIRDEKGEIYKGHCWPGLSVWIDSMNPEAKQYWASLYGMDRRLAKGATNFHVWNDMNEPSIFSGSESTAPKGLLHFKGWEHRDIHNLYGHEVLDGTRRGMMQRYSHQQRPFILARSFFAGSQKLGATWTGDNQATWEYLQIATPMILTHGIAGMPFIGADVGGFFKNPEPDLLVRWYQAGTFYPFFRAHAHIDSRRREPYLIEPPFNETINDAIMLRYQLLPTFYNAFHESYKSLAPIMRPLFYIFPENELSYEIDDAFFIGDWLLAKPVVTKDAKEIDVPLFGSGLYYDYFTGEAFEAPQNIKIPVNMGTIPLYVRGGGIVPRKDRPRRSAELMIRDPYTLLVALNEFEEARGYLYVDDGVSYDYQNGAYLEVNFKFENGHLSSVVDHRSETPLDDLIIERVIVYGSKASKAVVGGKEVDLIRGENRVILRNPRLRLADEWDVDFH